ncbi:TPA: 50S ribosomal protein L18 [bacterium]|nr:50S ribosomal protein L18 [bacterium]
MEKKIERRKKRKRRARKKIYGTAERPRLSVHRSLKYIYSQIINDDLGKTLTACSSIEKDIRDGSIHPKQEVTKKVGKILAERALEKGIKKVVFDRGCYAFSGRIKALAESAKEGGLEF